MTKLGKILRPARFILILVILIVAYWYSAKVTEIDFVKLVVSAPKARSIISQFLAADIFSRTSNSYNLDIKFPVPCGSADVVGPITEGPRIVSSVNCGEVGKSVTLTGYELGANADVYLKWRLPEGEFLSIVKIIADKDGNFTHVVEIRPIVTTKNGVPSSLEAMVTQKSNNLAFTKTVSEVVDAILVTIFMALLATTLGTLFAVPMGFLAASNISRHGVIGSAVYYVIRGVLNLIRSYEPLVMATVFALIVGYGTPFAGVLALVFVTTASLGKMFSEAVESIDPGPIEALRATGANPIQVVVYAVIPQIIPDFLSYTIYHWDINVRISTVIGFVGGGGIGYYLSQRINTFEYSKAGTALYAIIIVVWVLDFLSARIRKELI
jgi:phosphonate transport system permease protein